jgi:PHD/YefM family antitoxin component YafN of YafNO toxin-antitoxin module
VDVCSSESVFSFGSTAVSDENPVRIKTNGEDAAMVITIEDYRYYDNLEDQAEEEYLSKKADEAHADNEGESCTLDEMRISIMDG